MKCPHCKEIIDDDSYYCDQCGKELNFCPECGKPKQGVTCPACGSILVSGKVFFTSGGSEPQKASPQPDLPQSTVAVPNAKPQASSLSGNGWVLPLKEGQFGRIQGIYPEFSSQKYISRTHGQFRLLDGQWQVMDLNSHNGTFLNGQRLVVNTWYDLNIGDQLKIATTDFIVQ